MLAGNLFWAARWLGLIVGTACVPQALGARPTMDQLRKHSPELRQIEAEWERAFFQDPSPLTPERVHGGTQ